MNNQTTNNNNTAQKDAATDPVLEVETWKDATDKQTENMSAQELDRFYAEAERLIHPEPEK